MNELHRKTDPDESDFRSARNLPRKWRKWLAIITTLGGMLGGLITWITQQKRSLATKDELIIKTSDIQMDVSQAIRMQSLSLQDHIDAMPSRIDFTALRDLSRENQRTIQDLRSMFQAEQDRNQDRHTEEMAAIRDLEKKMARRW